MSIIDKTFCYANRTVLIALVALAGFAGSSAKAQVAPQLLPYSVKVIAGGGTTGTSPTYTTPFTPGECGPSGNTPTDIYGDGCLATEIGLNGPRDAVADVNGNVFFTDYTNGLIRRVDAITGIITAVAGGVSVSASPGTGADCVAGNSSTTSTDAKGDGCLGTQVFLIEPLALTFSPAGDLYFTEYSNNSPTAEVPFGADVRKIAATNGLITTTGVISMVDGALSGYNGGYEANPATCTPTSLATCINAATQSYLYAPYGVAFDTNGNLYIAEEHYNALLAVNTNTVTTNPAGYTTVAGVEIPIGTVAKIAGYSTTGGAYCPNGTASTSGCTKATTLFTNGNSANSSEIYDPYSIAVGPPPVVTPPIAADPSGQPSGNVYFVNEFNYDVAEISSTNTSTSYALADDIFNFAGVDGTGGAASAASVTKRATAGSFALGSAHGVTVDSLANAYITDSYVLNGTTGEGGIWRVDSADNTQYLVAGGAITFCTTSIVPGVTTIDAYGDGCPALQATFGEHAGTTGIFDVSVDSHSDLFVGDTLSARVREVASGTQFGPVGANQPTQYVEIHFGAGDGPATTGAYALDTGDTNFSLGTASCTTNSDTTEDCVLPIKATPTALGPFSGTLEVVSKLVTGPTPFPLSGDYVASPNTRTIVSASQAANCTNTTAYSTSTPVILSATIFTSGANPPGGTVSFYYSLNGGPNVLINSPVAVSNNAASTTYTFGTAGSYAITAVYSGDTDPPSPTAYNGSTSGAYTITSAVQSFSGAAIASQQNTVVPGQTALYSFTLTQTVYTGTFTFSCSGLPANSSCAFYPNSITASGCQTSSTIAMSIITQASAQTIAASSLGGEGRGWRLMLGILPGLALALLIGLRRRKVSLRYGQIWLALALLLAAAGITSCNGNIVAAPATPAFNGNVTVTVTGSTGTPSTFTVPLTVN